MKDIRLLGMFILLFVTTSCQKNFLDQVPDDKLTIDKVFQRKKLSEQYLANIYHTVQTSWQVNAWDPFECCSDEMDIIYNIPGNWKYASSLMNLGSWASNSDFYFFWDDYYKAIRSASYFMQHIGNNQEILKLPDGKQLITQYTAEARFLRAYFYFCLLRQYGPIPILPDKPIAVDAPSSDSLLHLARTPYDSCVNYIVEQLDMAAKDLPLNFTSQSEADYGRATAAACMVVKSRVLLYAASPLFNGNKDYAHVKNNDGTPLFSQQYDENKWKRAADAAKDIIDLGIFSLYKEYDENGEFSPYLSIRNVALEPWNKEWIFASMQNLAYYYDRYLGPRFASGYTQSGPTQQMVDAFFMANGRPPVLGYSSDGSPIINPESGYSETGFTEFQAPGDPEARKVHNMYVNRGPRFYADVVYNGSIWVNTTSSLGIKVVGLNYSGNTGAAGGGRKHTATGYLWKKRVSPFSNPAEGKYIARPTLMFRYAEVLLNYVEALNEYDPGNPDILKYLNKIRERAGIPQYGIGTDALPVPASQEAMRKAIHRERRVELCFEKQRYFDTRRWKIAEKTDGGPFYGMNILADGKDFYKRTIFETRVFLSNYYLFPIPQVVMDRDENMVQNPGW